MIIVWRIKPFSLSFSIKESNKQLSFGRAYQIQTRIEYNKREQKNVQKEMESTKEIVSVIKYQSENFESNWDIDALFGCVRSAPFLNVWEKFCH